MNTVIFIVIIISLIIGGIGGALFIQYGGAQILTDNNLISTYDCAKNYDKWRTFMEAEKNSDDYHNESAIEYSIYGDYELMENRCFITVKSWAHDSDYEQLIWASNWEGPSYTNQMYLGEIECKDPKVCESLEKQRNQYWDYLKLKK